MTTIHELKARVVELQNLRAALRAQGKAGALAKLEPEYRRVIRAYHALIREIQRQ